MTSRDPSAGSVSATLVDMRLTPVRRKREFGAPVPLMDQRRAAQRGRRIDARAVAGGGELANDARVLALTSKIVGDVRSPGPVALIHKHRFIQVRRRS